MKKLIIMISLVSPLLVSSQIHDLADTITFNELTQLFKGEFSFSFDLENYNSLPFSTFIDQPVVLLNNGIYSNSEISGYPHSYTYINEDIAWFVTMMEGEIRKFFLLRALNIRTGEVSKSEEIMYYGGDQGDFLYKYGSFDKYLNYDFITGYGSFSDTTFQSEGTIYFDKMLKKY